ncbi:MAG: hypothetical protein IJ111_02090 [Eggerthellaceae bacterium]|nr:hypothetical protein [Eggerthellaceae bacterium]
MINTSIGLIGVAKQTAKGTPAAAPAYVHGLTGGKTFNLERNVASADVSCGVRAGTDSYVESVVPGVDFDTYGYADVIPLYLYAAMGNIASAAASGGYDHTITLGDLLPYLTFWGRIGSEFSRVDSCKVDEIEMEFEGNAPLSFGITAVGLAATLGLSGFPGAADPSCFDGYFVPTGGTFLIDTLGDTPLAAPVTAGSLTLANSCTADPLAGQVTPGDVEEGKLTVSGSVTVKPEDMALYRKMVTGAAAGTALTGQMVYGSFEWTFKHSKNADCTLKISASRVPFTADYPDVDPNGGAAEMEFSFDNVGVESAGGSPITIVAHNAVESY